MSEYDQFMRRLAEQNVIDAAEEAAVGIRRLTVLHSLHPNARDPARGRLPAVRYVHGH